jgi:hypothetical protein
MLIVPEPILVDSEHPVLNIFVKGAAMDMIDKIFLSVAYKGIQCPDYLILTSLLESLGQRSVDMLDIASPIERLGLLIKAPPLLSCDDVGSISVSLSVWITFARLPLLARCFSLYVLSICAHYLAGCQFLYDFSVFLLQRL